MPLYPNNKTHFNNEMDTRASLIVNTPPNGCTLLPIPPRTMNSIKIVGDLI